MPNEEHLRAILQGMDQWQRLRSHLLDRPNLKDADLSDKDLSGFDLSSADMHRANLRRTRLAGARLQNAILDHAHLTWAYLERADLSDASLVDAQLSRADFSSANCRSARFVSARGGLALFFRASAEGADFSDADLTDVTFAQANLKDVKFVGAYLGHADLHRANLLNADFRNAAFSGTRLTHTNISDAKNLEHVRHYGPTVVDVETLLRPVEFDDKFLTGIGIPDIFLTYRESLSTARRPIQFNSCFISHSSSDADFCRRLHADLQDSGVRCWFAPEDLKVGDRFRVRIEESIRVYDKLLVVLSENSVRSEWVEEEVEAAFERERASGQAVLFPVRLDDAVMTTPEAWAASIRRTRHIGDFRLWKNHDDYQGSLQRLLRDLRAS
jgi:uncharacterized protein YjbI with pentapeptide repeats